MVSAGLVTGDGIWYTDTAMSTLELDNQALRDPDIQLMLAVQRDDAAAFEELVQHYQPRLLAFFRHAIGNQQQAEDLSQDVFLRVFRARKNYKPEAKFSTWVFTIANNVLLNAHRTKQRHPEVQMGIVSTDPSASGGLIDAEDAILASSGMIPTRRIDKMEMKQMVQLAIRSLNERQRMALLLNRFEGMSYLDIAEVMEMTPQGVKSLLCRARLNLRDLLEPYYTKGEKIRGDE